MDQDGDGVLGEADDVLAADIELRTLTTASGTIGTDTNWSGTVHVTSNLSVAAEATLTIERGTVVKVAAGAGIDIMEY